MRLVSLKVIKSTTSEIIREIIFNENGLSLIVDETNKISSGSNIGKTTAVKIIDLCLGAKSISSIYKEKDTGENTIVGEFIKKNKVVGELTCKIDGEIHVFKRALYKSGKNEINGVPSKNINEYRQILNKIIFNNLSDKPSLRQLISKFIRLEEANETALLKFLSTYPSNYEYQAVYEYLFGIDESKSENVDIISLNERIDKDIEVIYRKNGVSSWHELKTKISLMKEEVEKFKKEYSEVTVIDDYENKVEENQALLSYIQGLEEEYSKLNLKQELLQSKIKKEEEKVFSVDTKLLRQLYEETKLILDKQLCDFEDLEKFHNGMVNKRIAMLKETHKELSSQVRDVYDILQEQRRLYEKKYVSLNVELKDKFEEKYKEFSINNIKLETFNHDLNYINEKLEEKEDNLSKIVAENTDKTIKDEIEECFNNYFKELTKKIIGETFAIVLNREENVDEFPLKIVGMNGKPGTGIKKAMIACFDLAHIDLIIEKNYHMPTFAIHDKMENIALTELAGIIKETREFEGQYIFPILSDRIDMMGISEKEIVLRLSSKDKFFRI